MRIDIDVSDISLNLAPEKHAEIELAKRNASRMALDFHGRVVLATPVDIGNARAGWTVDVASPIPVVENNVEYIGALNRGHSSQAPAGFVEAALDAARRSRSRP